MPYINDPYELTLPPQSYSEVNEEEPRHWSEFFYDDQPYPGARFAGAPDRAYTEMCRFDEEGNHTVMAEHCPHFDEADEEGRIVRKGWTVQSG
jgi:hypothetical protein